MFKFLKSNILSVALDFDDDSYEAKDGDFIISGYLEDEGNGHIEIGSKGSSAAGERVWILNRETWKNEE